MASARHDIAIPSKYASNMPIVTENCKKANPTKSMNFQVFPYNSKVAIRVHYTITCSIYILSHKPGLQFQAVL